MAHQHVERLSLVTVLAVSIVATGCSSADENAQYGSYAVPPSPTALPSSPPAQDPAERPAPLPAEPSANAPAVSPFVDSHSDPFSTFGADVDTASYDYFRQSLGGGTLPAPKFVRTEDFVNFFEYGYAAPAEGQPFAIDLAAVPHPMGRSTTLLRVGIQARTLSPAEIPPANLVFLVDVSGSMMSSEKLPLVKTLLKEALRILPAEDKISIVTYAGSTGVRLGPTPVSDRQKIEVAIDGMEAGGGTNGASGIQLAYDQARIGHVEGINHVVLCTDGDFNLGITSTDALIELVRQQRDSGVTLTALGFGHDNLNDPMMEAVSNSGNGMYGVIYDPDQAISYANERLLSTVAHVAKDMKIQVEFNPDRVVAYRLLGYEDRAIADQDFRNDRTDGGEVGSGHRVTALYELILAGAEVPVPAGAPPVSVRSSPALPRQIGDDALVEVRVRSKLPGQTDSDPATEVVSSLAPADVDQASPAARADLEWAAAVASFAERLRGSPYAAPSELGTIRAVASAQRNRDAARSEFAALLDRATPLMGAGK